MSRRNEFWTRERITLALARFVAEHGRELIPEYDVIAKNLGEGMDRASRPYPTTTTVRMKFSTIAEAWRAAGVDMPDKPRKASKQKANRTTIAERVLSGVSKGPACNCAGLRAERDELAAMLGRIIRGAMPDEELRALRVGILVGSAPGTKADGAGGGQ